MPLSTDLSTSPYFSTFDIDDDYYRILFRPGVAVQTRELNDLQAMTQNQIEQMGDNIFKRGTIISGCDITFHSSYPYVKLKDNETDSTPVNVAQYIGYNVKNQANLSPLIATVQTAISGYESQAPDLNTIYVRYVNSGYSNVAGTSTEQATFAANDILTVYSPKNIIEKVLPITVSSGFSNTDSVIFTSAIAIQNTTGGTAFANSFNVGDYITDGTANAQIQAIDTTTNTAVVILRISPRALDLQAANSYLWTFTQNTNIQTTNTTPSSVANVVSIIGSGAAATMVTGQLGEIDTVAITNKGSGYYALPYVSISSTGATTGQINTANLVAQNYLTTVQVANSNMAPSGYGYAVSVGAGTVYQKGYFAQVNEHLVVVSKYANTPDALSVGFDTTETIINSNQDTSLLDNATGAPNYAAPGANRLKLTPTLVVRDTSTAEANTDFLSIIQFSAGNPYKQNRQTVYNIIGNTMAQRTYEEAGDFVIDQFNMNTLSPSDFAKESSVFDISIDPGTAYIQGNRVETDYAYQADVNKGIDTVVANNASISLNYGNYLRVNNVGGVFMFKTGDVVQLWMESSSYVQNGVGTPPNTGGLTTNLGTARIRSMTLESGTPGTAQAVYRLYLFDIQLATAHNLSLVKTIYYAGANPGIAAVVQDSGVTNLYDNNGGGLVYYAGNPAVKNANNLSYIYRTIANNLTLTTNGIISWSVTGGETFPYVGQLSTTEENDLIIVPLTNAQMANNLQGSLATNASNTLVTGTGTNFTASLNAGDFINIANTVIGQVNQIVNDTQLYLVNQPLGAYSGNAAVYFPSYIPISLQSSTRTANVDITASTFYVNLGGSLKASTPVAVAYNVKTANTTPVNKNVHRDRYIRLQLSSNEYGTSGPWSLGIPDVFRLTGVYRGSNTTFSETDAGVSDITANFYVDHNQNIDYYGLSYLYTQPNTPPSLTTDDVLLVKVAHFTDAGPGLKGPGASGSYPISDSVTLENSVSTINTLEIPEVFDDKGNYYDLRDQFDFRPQAANTVASGTTAATAPINPAESNPVTRFDATDKKFPAPDSSINCNIEYYVGRASRITVDSSGSLNVVEGTPGSNTAPVQPSDAMTISILNIPPYPSIPYQMSQEVINFLDTNVANEKYTTKRLTTYRVTTPTDANTTAGFQPKGYSMYDIGKLERRIAALEYYTSYTLVELITQQKTISSSVDSSVDRYKFGYFVDSFSDSTYADTTNPAYRASIIDGYLSPYAEELNLLVQDKNSTTTMLPFTEYSFLSQSQATNGAVIVVANTATAANTSTGTVTVSPTIYTGSASDNVQTTTAVIQGNRTTSYSDSAGVYEDFYYNFSSSAGAVMFFMSCGGGATAAEFAQSTNINGTYTVTHSSATSTSITTADANQYSLGTLNNVLSYLDGTSPWPKYGSAPYGGFIRDQYKVLFNYDPSAGVYVRVRIYKGSIRNVAVPAGTYQYKMYFPTDSTTDDMTTSGTTSYYNGYSGFLATDGYLDPIYTAAYSYGASTYGQYVVFASGVFSVTSGTTYIVGSQASTITLTGLKPLTVHNITVNGTNINDDCRPKNGGLLGDPIVTDANGNAQFLLYYGSFTESSSAIQKSAIDLLNSAGTKTLVASSSDGTSTATLTLPQPVYVYDTSFDTSSMSYSKSTITTNAA